MSRGQAVAARGGKAAEQAPWSKPELSRVILTGTVGAISLLMLLWLIVAPMRGRGGSRPSNFLAGVLPPPLGVGGELSYSERGIEALAGRRGVWSKETLESVPEAAANMPLVLYLTGVGVSLPGDSKGKTAYLLLSDGRLEERESLYDVEEFITSLQERKQKALLILDWSTISSDRGVGIFGNGFVQRLKSLVDERGNLVVMTACAPGQLSWGSERDGESVFGHYVVMGLVGKAKEMANTNVRSLYEYVSRHVSAWVREHHEGAAQTPLLLGNTELSFSIPRLEIAEEARERRAPSEEEVAGAIEQLMTEWKTREALAAMKPYRQAPVKWRLYQEELLRAERLFRAGRLEEIEGPLAQARQTLQEIQELPKALRPEETWTLAMLEGMSRMGGKEAAEQAERAIEGYKNLCLSVLGMPPSTGMSDLGGGAAAGAGEAPGAQVGLEEGVAGTSAGEGGAVEKAEAKKPAAAEKGSTTKKKAAAPPTKEQAKKGDPAGKAAAEGEAKEKPAGGGAAVAAGAGAAPDVEKGALGGLLPGGAGMPGAGLEDPTVLLRLQRRPDLPRFVEGQIALWYLEFTKLGGESDGLRTSRQEELRKAFDTRLVGERAASPWALGSESARPLVEEGDQLRREAQDLLFSDSEDDFQTARGKLEVARGKYESALRAVGEKVEAWELLQQLLDELPHYGEWLARVENTRAEALLERLLEGAEELAEALRPGQPGGEKANTGVDLEALRSQLASLETVFEGAVREAKSSPYRSWRNLDALLRVPMMLADDRLALLGKIGSGGSMSESEGSELGGLYLGEPEVVTDHRFWQEAITLARVELAMLKVAAADEKELAGLERLLEDVVKRAKGLDEEAEAMEALDEFSEGIRQERNRLVLQVLDRSEAEEESDRGEEEEDQSKARRSGRESVSELLGARGQGDLLARAVPGTAGQRVAEATTAFVKAVLHDGLVWQSKRLLADYAPGHADLLLNDAYRYSLASEEFVEADGEKAAQEESLTRGGVVVSSDRPEGASTGRRERIDVGAQVKRGEIPEGRAAIVFRRGSGAGAAASVQSGQGNLITLGSRESREEMRSFEIARAENLEITPAVFYRGHTFESEEAIPIPKPEDLISIDIKQARKLRGIPDQFDEHPLEGYLHPTQTLEYKLVITNKSKNRMRVRIERDFGEASAKSDVIDLEPLGQNELLRDTVYADTDLKEGEGRPLVITATEAADGSPVCEPVTATFRKVPASPYVVAQDGLNGSVFFVHVAHAFSDPVPMPLPIRVKVEPAGVVRELRRSALQNVLRGTVTSFDFQILRPVPKLKWTVEVYNEVVKTSEMELIPEESKKEEPAAPAAGPAGLGGQPPAF